jgi:hypothetical protein
MINPVWFLSALLCTSSAMLHAAEPASASRVMPVAPVDLLRLLPPSPPGWKIIQSVATQQRGNWLMTIAMRSYVLTPETDSTKTDHKIMKTSIRLIDTGREPSFLTPFEGFRESGSNSEESMLYRKVPVKVKSQSGRESVDALIDGRFLLRLDLINQPSGNWKIWMDAFPLPQFASIPASPAVAELPSALQIQTVDELNPANNRTVVEVARVGPSEGTE